MANIISTAITWIETETGIMKADVIAIEPAVIAWAKNFLSVITPVIRQAATDGVLAAVSVPGSGEIKFAAAVAAAAADLATKGIPVVESQLKAAVQIAYDGLPEEVTHNVAAAVVVSAANSEIDTVGAKIEASVPAA